MALELRQLLLRLVLLVQSGVDDLVAVGDLTTRARMNHHFLGGLVHGQQLAQVDERLLAGLSFPTRDSTSSNMSFDQVVLSFEELDDVIGRLNKCFEPRRLPPISSGGFGARGLCATQCLPADWPASP